MEEIRNMKTAKSFLIAVLNAFCKRLLLNEALPKE